ncbi:SDR family NAD(P)-dependent oxidoreductase [Marinoscillum furvescens]|uniref:NAD(P)-dependent dehydrogenase (Short-subunit alcohol dehydrogenase family) n=1 Tax=Marinoscillum furvescens DSM 4134 TaxID=1122208 RepID=A0A3D9L6N1_MARFU|nr:SDR family oxidoreductase [Marinoscillum furvescens]REE02009.1 NAD(P)-dependent dehydrogenase (short-subunit alcohol dehydrogenase family) [Marinoscillum furvescens DSM 4134]
MQTFDLSGKTAIITGGASGIGKAIATKLAQHGAHAIILDVNEENAKELSEAIAKDGGKSSYGVCDITNADHVAETFTQLLGDSSLDILINNAGIAHIGNLLQTTGEDLDKVYQVNVKGAFHCAQEAVKRMETTGGGSIINVSSIAAHVGIADRLAYSMSKGAIHALSLSIARDFLDKNIRCNTVSPARVHTPFVDGFIAKNYAGQEEEIFDKLSKSQPIGRMGKPEEVGALVLYLCADEASFITGSDFPIDGGFVTLNN